jgi:Mg-chelatase subunit ChlD
MPLNIWHYTKNTMMSIEHHTKHNLYKRNTMKNIAGLITALLIFMTYSISFAAENQSAKIEKPGQIEVVFVLDTTGSMGGLIEGAKNKIWYITTEIQNAEPTPEVKIGLIGYRDQGDDYVTKIYPISTDIHKIYDHLLDFKAKGGGDTPESVNQALHEAVTQMNWSDDKDTLRLVFLVGDSPPKMNYQDDVKYNKSASLASQKDIIINTVLCGGNMETARIWKEIAQMANGEYSAIKQSGNVTVIETPYDVQIQKLNIQLNGTAIIYGSIREKEYTGEKLNNISTASPSMNADISSFNMRRKSKAQIITGRGELIRDIDDNIVSLDKIKKEELPENMQSMTITERKTYLKEVRKKREKIHSKIDELVKKRSAYLTKERAKLSKEKKEAFDYKVIDQIKEQGTRKGIKY